MSHDLRETDPGFRPTVVLVDMDIRTADRYRKRLDENVVIADFRNLTLDHRRTDIGGKLTDRLHSCVHGSTP